jgi:hypothetical protein
MEGVSRPIAFGFTVCAGNRPEDLRDRMKVEEMRSGGWDPKVRLAELDDDNVNAQFADLAPYERHAMLAGNALRIYSRLSG